MGSISFIYYTKLSIIWGIDRATGEVVETPGDMLESLQREGNLNKDDFQSSDEDNVYPTYNNDESIATQTRGRDEASSKQRKRKKEHW